MESFLAGNKDEDIGTKRRNPAWNREELILALDAYVRWGGEPPSKSSGEIAALSAEVGGLRRSLGSGGDETLRNTNGVYMKLMNFRRFDLRFQDQGKTGLTRGNRLEENIWDEFAHDPARLSRVANDVRASLSADTAQEMQLEAITERMPPERREYIRELVVRNRQHVADLKRLYEGRCQVSGKLVLDGLAGDITEVHHIEWLTRGGLDVEDNMVVLAPDIHAARW